MKRCGVVALTCAMMCAAASEVSAQSLSSARYGQRFVSVGLSSQPGIILDDDSPPTPAHQEVMSAWGTLVVLGLHHYLHPHFSMAAELGLGLQWLDEHTVTPRGQHEAEKAFAWQAGLLGRYIPSSGLHGLSLGAGLHLFTARLDDAPLKQLAAEVRTGWIFWRGERAPRFGLVEVGVSAPIVQGLKLPAQVVLFEGDEQEPVEPSNWRMWRGSITLQVSF